MTQEVPKPEPQPPPPTRRLGPAALVWRIAAVIVIVAGVIALARYLRNPSDFGSAAASRPATVAAAGDADDMFTGAPAAGEAGSAEERKAALSDLRKVMAGILMNAADEDGPYQDPANQDPAARRQFLADRFGLPFDYPRSEVPPDLLPKEAQVLIVFDNPEGDGSRMVLMRFQGDVSRALGAIHKHYTAGGWTAAEQPQPQAQTDRGWLMRFSKDRRVRVVYARPRQAGDETLVAVYDSPH